MHSDWIRIGDEALAATRRLQAENQLPAPAPPVCAVCRGAIKRDEGRYRVGETEYHRDCFPFWMTVSSAPEDDLSDTAT